MIARWESPHPIDTAEFISILRATCQRVVQTGGKAGARQRPSQRLPAVDAAPSSSLRTDWWPGLVQESALAATREDVIDGSSHILRRHVFCATLGGHSA